MELKVKEQVVRTFFLLLILCLATKNVNAVTREDLDELQIIDDVTTERESSDKTIETNQNQQRPRLFDKDEPLGMDSLTIIWYLTTFTVLLGFFVVMACTEKSCNRNQDSKPPETITCPPTPCPSYKNFAPPSYDSVLKKFKSERVFIVPVHENNNFFTRNMTENAATVSDIEKGSNGVETTVR